MRVKGNEETAQEAEGRCFCVIVVVSSGAVAVVVVGGAVGGVNIVGVDVDVSSAVVGGGVIVVGDGVAVVW